MSSSMRHLVLLGDSIFDNGSYVDSGQPSVIDQLKAAVRDQGSNATLVAVDGNVLSHVADQIKRVPRDATHLFISIGIIDSFLVEIKIDLLNIFRWKQCTFVYASFE